MKFVANRRMAIDAAEADVDEAGGMSQLRGIKLVLTDPKVCIVLLRANTYIGIADSKLLRLTCFLSCTT